LERPERRIPGSASAEFNTLAVTVARRLPLHVDRAASPAVAGARAEQPRADAADGLTSNRSFTEESNMTDETTPAGLWERTKAWADKNRTISGALVGGAAGTIVPGLGTMIGAIVGAGVGFASSKEKEKKEDR
jgi:outer membrane protein with glycine zipper